MERRACTARIEHGRTKTKPCRNVAPCTRVRVLNEAGDVLHDRWVCPTCRTRMRLPEHDIDFRPGDTEVSDEIVHDEQLATGGLIEDPEPFTVGDRGPEEFRLP